MSLRRQKASSFEVLWFGVVQVDDGGSLFLHYVETICRRIWFRTACGDDPSYSVSSEGDTKSQFFNFLFFRFAKKLQSIVMYTQLNLYHFIVLFSSVHFLGTTKNYDNNHRTFFFASEENCKNSPIF